MTVPPSEEPTGDERYDLYGRLDPGAGTYFPIAKFV